MEDVPEGGYNFVTLHFFHTIFHNLLLKIFRKLSKKLCFRETPRCSLMHYPDECLPN